MRSIDELIPDLLVGMESSLQRQGKEWAKCESPIEQRLCHALFAIGCKSPVGNRYHVAVRSHLAELCEGKPAAFVYTQQSIGIYRADFFVVLIDPASRRSRNFIIEADGKDFHDPERDQDRDAKLIARGVNEIIRLSGSEIHSHLSAAMAPICDRLRAFGIEPDLDALRFLRSDAEDRQQRAQLRATVLRADAENACVEHYRRSLETGIWDDKGEN